MYVREKSARGHTCLYLVESVQEGRKIRQRTIRALGRKDRLPASGEPDRPIASFVRHSQRPGIRTDPQDGRLSCARIGGPLLFDRLWRYPGIGSVIAELLRRRRFDCPVERAIFVGALHRLSVAGSDYNTERPHSVYADKTPAEAYGAGRPLDMMDKAAALTTYPQPQQQQQDVINKTLAA